MTQVRDTATKVIDGIEYEVTLLNTSRAFNVMQQLMKLSLPSIGAAADGFMFGDEFTESQTWQAVAIHMLNQMDSVDTLGIVKELVKTLKSDGIPVDFDTYFRGRLDLLVKVLEFVLKDNFSSLFTGTSLMNELLSFIAVYQTRATTKAEIAEPQKEQGQ